MDHARTAPVTAIEPGGQRLVEETAALRGHGDAVPVELPSGIRAWAVTRHDLARRLLTDDRVSKDPRQHWTDWIEGRHRATWIQSWVGVDNMFTAYGAAHRRLRTLVSPAFTKKRTDGLIPRVREITGSLLDALDQTPHGQPVDLRERFTHPLPMAVICELFGVPADRRAETGSLIAGITNTAATPEEAAATFVAVHELLADLVAAKRAAPGDDLTSALIAAREGDTALTESELVDTLLLVIGAGFETTVHLIGNAVHALLTHPDQHELVRTGARTWDEVIEETLRWAPSIAGLPLRYAVEDIRVDDAVTIAEGEAILINYLAANHDPRRFGADAGAFDLTREDKDHLAFGWGVHRCIGAPLARAEAGIALPELFARFPGLRLAAGPDGIAHVNSFITHGHETLPVRLTG